MISVNSVKWLMQVMLRSVINNLLENFCITLTIYIYFQFLMFTSDCKNPYVPFILFTHVSCVRALAYFLCGISTVD